MWKMVHLEDRRLQFAFGPRHGFLEQGHSATGWPFSSLAFIPWKQHRDLDIQASSEALGAYMVSAAG